MKVVILAGGFGTRISEESYAKPKPMIEIGDKPILWHIMKHYSYYGHNEFIICCGYKQHIIKDWFAHYYLYNNDITVDLISNNIEFHNNNSEPWKVTLVDTGLYTMTGGRIKRIRKYIENQSFLLTYGDGISDVNINEVIKFHKNQGKIVTLTAVQPEGRFGVLNISEDNTIINFAEKEKKDSGWINGGFMVVEPEIFDYIEDDNTVFESHTLKHLSKINKLAAYKHYGFWMCMDTQRDKKRLETIWNSGKVPWKIWD